MKLADGKVRLIKEQDLPLVLSWRNSERISRNMFSDHSITMEEHRRWFAGLNNSSRVCLIFELNARPVGVVNASDIDKDDNKCSWGFYLGETDLPRGAGLLMGYHGLQFIFEELNIRKINSKVFSFNESSVKYHKKLGFKEEGLLLKDGKKNGKYEDVVVLALFKDQWQQRYEEIARILEKTAGDEAVFFFENPNNMSTEPKERG